MLNSALGVVAAVLAAAAFGAIWSLIALATSSRAPWLAIVAAIGIVVLLRFNEHPPSIARALSAAALSALAIAHANYLMAAGFIGAQMSMSYADLLWRMGIEMAVAVSRAHAEPLEPLAYALAFGIAFALGWRMPGEGATKLRKRRSAAASR